MRTERESNAQNPVLETGTERKERDLKKTQKTQKTHILSQSLQKEPGWLTPSVGHISHFLLLKHSAPNNQLKKKKGLSWFMVLELSVPVLWVLLLWVMAEQCHPAGSAEKAVPFMAARDQTENK